MKYALRLHRRGCPPLLLIPGRPGNVGSYRLSSDPEAKPFAFLDLDHVIAYWATIQHDGWQAWHPSFLVIEEGHPLLDPEREG